ncbi:hypothetical protein [Virgibacillus ainsalahensis]
MQGLFEFIANNFFLVIIIIAGILGFFRNNAAQQQEQNRKAQPPGNRNNVPRPTPYPSGGNESQQESRTAEQPSQRSISTTSVEEQQNEQMDRLARKLRTDSKQEMEKLPHDAIRENTSLERSKDLSKNQEEVKSQIKDNLDRKGLVNGIIMSEVLGPPRAKKPYQSVLAKKRNS